MEADLARRPGLLAGMAAWSPGHLELSPDAVATVARKRLSASTADAMRSCVGRWAIEKLLGRTEHPFGAAELGTATHQLFEDFFALPPEQRTQATALELLEDLDVMHAAKLAAPDDPIELESWRQEVWRRAKGLWKIEDPSSVRVVSREMRLDTKVAGVPFVGFIDRVSLDDEDRVTIEDFKAGLSKMKDPKGRYGDPHGEQIRLYALALCSKHPQLAGDDPTRLVGRVLYVAHGRSRQVELSPESLEKVSGRFRTAWEDHNAYAEQGRFPLRPSPLCGWCPAVEACPAAAAKGLGPRNEQALGGEGLGISPLSDARPFAPPSSVPEPPEIDPEVVAMKHEGKPFEEVTPNSTDLNPNSYAAGAAFGTASMSVEVLHSAGQPVTAASVKALARTFARLVAGAAVDLDYRPSFQAGIHTRLRGALHTSISTMPPPFGDDLDAWVKWESATRRRMLSIAKTAFELWEHGNELLDDDGTADLAVLAELDAPRLSVVEGAGASSARRRGPR